MKTKALVTFEDFETMLAVDAGKQELVQGKLVTLPPAKRASGEIGIRLFDALRVRCGSRVYIEMGYLIGTNPRSWLQPDVSVRHADQPGDDYLEGAPLIAVEIISEANRSMLLDRKVQLYLQSGAAEVWLVYPENRCVWVHGADRKTAERFENTLTSRAIPAFELSLADLFNQ